MSEESIQVSSALLDQRLSELAAALGKDTETIVRDEARLFLKAAIAITPPKNRAQGENAVKRDLRRIFGVVTDGMADYVAHEFGTHDVRHWLTNEVTHEHYEVEWAKLDPQGYGMEEFHKQNRRASDGHTNRIRFGQKSNGAWLEKYVVSDSAFKSYLAKASKHVGTQKSGWLRAYYEIGGKLAAWIQRNAERGKGTVSNNLGTPGHPSITMGNHADGIGNTKNDVQAVFKIRINSITRRIKLALGGYSADIRRKTAISRKERESFGGLTE